MSTSSFDLVTISLLTTSKEDIIIKTIKETIDRYKVFNYEIKQIEFDAESSFTCVVPYLHSLGIYVNERKKGAKCYKAERKVRTIKERFRSMVHSLPFQLPASFIQFLAQFVVTRLNPNSKQSLHTWR